MLLFSEPFTCPGFFGILCLVASHLVCRRLLLRRRVPLLLLALLRNGPRLLLLASLARRGRITRISAVSSSLGGSGRSGGQRKAQGRSQPDGTTLPMRMLSGLPPLWRQCLIMGQSWVVVVLRDDYCVPFKDTPPPRSHTPVAFTASQVGSRRAPALRKEVEVRLAKGTLGITLSPGPGFTSVSSWWARPLDGWRPMIGLSNSNEFSLLTPDFFEEYSLTVLFSSERGIFLALLDLGIAYFQIPIRPSSRMLLRIHVRGNGLYIPPLVFVGLSTALQPFTRLCVRGHTLLRYAFSAIWAIGSFLPPWSEKPNRRSSRCPPIVTSAGL